MTDELAMADAEPVTSDEKPLDAADESAAPSPVPNEALNYTLALVMIGVTIAILVGVLTTAYVGGFCLTAILVMAAIVRAIAGDRGPRGLAVRSRSVDVTTLLVLAAAMGIFSQQLMGI